MPVKLPSVKLIFLISTILCFSNVTAQQGQKKSIAQTLYAVVKQEGVDAALAKYGELKKKQPAMYDFSEPQLNQLGYRLMGEGMPKAALAVFKLNVERFPNSVNVYDSLGECYFTLGEREKAIDNYRKVLSMLDKVNLPANRKNFFKRNAQTRITIAENFDVPGPSALNYVSYFGGQPAGNWDMQNLIEFKNNHELKVSYTPNNLYRRPVPNTIATPFEDGAHADVVSSFVGGVYRKYVRNGAIADISDLWQAQGWDNAFPASFKRLVTYERRPYFVPQAFQLNPIWYRKDIFEKHGWQPPQTWEELLTLCEEIHAAGYSPFTVAAEVWPPPVARWFTILNLRLNGPDFYEQVLRGEVPYTDEKIKNVFAHWRELFEHHAFGDSTGWNNYQAAIQEIVAGKAVMYNLGEWLFEGLWEPTPSQLDFFVFPELNPEVRSAEIVHTYGAFMLADSQHPETAKALLRYLGSKASQTSNVKAIGRVNANLHVDQDLYTDVQKRLFQRVKETEVLVPLFEFSTHPEMAETALKAFVEFWRYPGQAEQILAVLEEQRRKVFASK